LNEKGEICEKKNEKNKVQKIYLIEVKLSEEKDDNREKNYI